MAAGFAATLDAAAATARDQAAAVAAEAADGSGGDDERLTRRQAPLTEGVHGAC
jgi:hypothetical protein